MRANHHRPGLLRFRSRVRLFSTATMLASAALMVSPGCTTKPGPAPRAGLSPGEFGELAVTTFANTPRVYLQVPDDKRTIAAEPITFEVITPRDFGIQPAVQAAAVVPEAAPLVAAVCTAGPAVVMLASPVAQTARKLYGIAVTDSVANVADAVSVLTPLSEVSSIELMLQAEVLHQLKRRHPSGSIRPVPASVPAPTPSIRRAPVPAGLATPRPTGPDGERSYIDVARCGMPTVLEIKLLEPGLHGAERINARLVFTMHVRVRLIDTATGTVLHYDYLEYASERRTFVAWAADDARLFRQAVSRCVEAMGGEIVAQMFGSRGEFAPDEQLARAGLYRRPRAEPATLAAYTPSSRRYAGMAR